MREAKNVEGERRKVYERDGDEKYPFHIFVVQMSALRSFYAPHSKNSDSTAADCIFSNLFNIEIKKRPALKQYILHKPAGIIFSLGARASGLTCTLTYKYHICLLYVFHSIHVSFSFENLSWI